MERSERSDRAHRRGELYDEQPGTARRIPIEGCMDHAEITPRAGRSLGVVLGVGVRDEAEVAIGVIEGAVLREQKHRHEQYARGNCVREQGQSHRLYLGTSTASLMR
jgi:hypothetical protein